jgi:hypothetical protein
MSRLVKLNHKFPIKIQYLRLFLTIFVVGLSYITIINLQINRLSQLDRKANQPLSKAEYLREEQQIQTSLKVLAKLPTFGFKNLIADWSFLNFIQYFGDDQARPQTGYRITPDFFKIIVDRDPHFLGMYPYLSSSISLYGGQPQQTVRLLQQGINAMPPVMQPEAYFLWQAKATDELLFLGRTQDARRSYEMAASWASQSKDPQMQAIAPIVAVPELGLGTTFLPMRSMTLLVNLLPSKSKPLGAPLFKRMAHSRSSYLNRINHI